MATTANQVDEAVAPLDLRPDEPVDLRSEPAPKETEYRCTTIRRTEPVMPPPGEWERSEALVEFPSDLGDWIADRRRESLEPGHLSAAVLESLAEDDLGPFARWEHD